MQDRQRNRSAILLGKAKSCNRTISHVELQVLVDAVWLSTRMTVREYASTFDQILNACSSPPVRNGRLSVTIPKKPNDFTDDASGRQRKIPHYHCIADLSGLSPRNLSPSGKRFRRSGQSPPNPAGKCPDTMADTPSRTQPNGRLLRKATTLKTLQPVDGPLIVSLIYLLDAERYELQPE